MWNNPSVIDVFIDQEIDRLCESEPSDARSQISCVSKLVLHGQLSIDGARQRLYGHPSALAILRQIQQITLVSDAPLPALGGSARSRRKSYPWTGAEDLRLLVAVARFGARDWRTIALFVGAGRSRSQCNQRWCRAIDPSISRRSWSDRDDERLLKAVAQLGTSSWCRIAKSVGGRTDLQCRYRYIQLTKAKQTVATPLIGMPPVESSPMLPYYLESSLTPRKDPSHCLHRLPPLLCPRKPAAPVCVSTS
jgi:hypothetical protein